MPLKFKIEGSRNPLISLPDIGVSIQTIGDPHLGRVFKTGVPSHRLSDREHLVKQSFIEHLIPQTPTVRYVVIMGDLFDKFIVSPSTVLFAATAIKDAVVSFPQVTYCIIPGNHDLTKDRTKSSSYELFYHLINSFAQNHTNLCCVFDKHRILAIPESDVLLYLDCYNPFATDTEYLKLSLQALTKPYELISFGHWDSVVFEEETAWKPSAELIDATALFVSGHEHTPNKKKLKTVPYLITGSMQPYSFAEDPAKLLYVVLDHTDLTAQSFNKASYKNKNVKILCDHGYVIPFKLDCLSLTYMYYKYMNLTDTVKIPESSENQIRQLQNSPAPVIADFTTDFLTAIYNSSEFTETQKDTVFSIINNKEYCKEG